MDYSPYTSSQWLDALAGGLGGAVKAMTLQGTWWQKFSSILAGAICALYLAPVFDVMLESTIGKLLPTDRAALHLGGFLCGMVGLGIVGFVIGVFKQWAELKGVKQS